VIRASYPKKNKNAKIPNYPDNLEEKRQKTVPLGMAYAKDRRQRTENRRRRTEDRGQKTEDGKQRTEDGGLLLVYQIISKSGLKLSVPSVLSVAKLNAIRDTHDAIVCFHSPTSACLLRHYTPFLDDSQIGRNQADVYSKNSRFQALGVLLHSFTPLENEIL